MLTKLTELNILEGLVEVELLGGQFTDGDDRARITIRLPVDVNHHDSVVTVERQILTWALKEIQAQLASRE